MNEAEKFILGFCEKPGMYIHSTRFDAIWAFVEGFSVAREGKPLHGFRQWLVIQRSSFSNAPWFMLIRERVYPESDPGFIPSDGEHESLRHELYQQLHAFFRERNIIGITKIMSDYETLLAAASQNTD